MQRKSESTLSDEILFTIHNKISQKLAFLKYQFNPMTRNVHLNLHLI
jgi:hypothetical protein